MPKTKYEWWDLCKGVLLLATLLTSGVGLGYWYKGTERDSEREAEIARLQANHTATLEVLAGRINRAAEKVTDTADLVVDAAASAAASAAAAKSPKPGRATVPAATRAENRAINQAVRETNSKLKDER